MIDPFALPEGCSLMVHAVAMRGDDGKAISRVLLRTSGTTLLMTPEEADQAAEYLRSYAQRARDEAAAIAAQPEAAQLALMQVEGQA